MPGFSVEGHVLVELLMCEERHDVGVVGLSSQDHWVAGLVRRSVAIGGLFGLLDARSDFPVLLIRSPARLTHGFFVPPGTGLSGGGRRLVAKDYRGSSGGCSD